MDDYIIDQVAWHTQLVGNNESPIETYKRFKNISIFLQNEGLTTHNLIKSDESINDDFCIKVSDLTDEGFLLMQKSYDKWLGFIDKGGSPDNLSIFEKALKIIRQEKNMSHVIDND